MSQPQYARVFISAPKGQLTMHADAKGLSVLIASREGLKAKAEQGVSEHDHFFTSIPGDGLLSEKRGCEKEGEVVHHLKLCGWSKEWAKKHGFIK